MPQTDEARDQNATGEAARSAAAVLVHRNLTPDEARWLHEELKTTPNILGYTVPELLRFREVIVAESGGAFAGACLSKDLLFGWTDIAALYMLPDFRQRGIGALLYRAAFARAEERGRHIFTLSRSPEVIRLMERLGLNLTRSVWRAPLAFHLHMNRHMASAYRLKESVRKASALPKNSQPFVAGMKRHARQNNNNTLAGA